MKSPKQLFGKNQPTEIKAHLFNQFYFPPQKWTVMPMMLQKDLKACHFQII